MTNLLFLGQIPFTNIYIGFWVWLELVIAAPLAIYLIHRHRWELPAWLLAVYVAWMIHRSKLTQANYQG